MSNSWFVKREQCPACASPRFKDICHLPYDEPPIRDYLQDFYSPQGMVEPEYLHGVSYVLCECAACALIFQKYIPNEALTKRIYELWIDPRKAFEQRHDSLAYYSDYAQEIMQMISYFKKKPSLLSFFDFGMGWGNWALMAKAFGCQSYGTELSEERMEHATSNGIKIIARSELPQYKFDFINTEQVFEHIAEPLKTLRHLKGALAPGGLLKLSVPTANDIERRLGVMDWKAPKDSRDSLNPVAPLEHINCFRRKSLLTMAAEAGMEEVFVPMRIQYQSATGWCGARRIVKKMLLPVYRNVFKKQNYVLLRHAAKP